MKMWTIKAELADILENQVPQEADHVPVDIYAASNITSTFIGMPWLNYSQ